MRHGLIGALLLLAFAPAVADEVLYVIRVDGVTCPFCIATSERALAKIRGVKAVDSDLRSGTIYVCTDSSVELSGDALQRLFESKGFSYRSVRKTSGCEVPTARPPAAGRRQ
jgi:copper chaperone